MIVRVLLAVLLLILAATTSRAAVPTGGAVDGGPVGSGPVVGSAVLDGFFQTSDGVRLHYLEAGPATANTILFVPGWAMPAWIWQPQLAFFAHHYHVVALDPRGQGDSEVPASGYEPVRRGQDIDELISHLGSRKVLLVGWSLGVLDSLSWLHDHGDTRLAGLVLVDNSVGEDPPPAPRKPALRKPGPVHRGPVLPYAERMHAFVQGMFHHPQTAAYIESLTEAVLHLPELAARHLLAYPVPRSFWKEAVYSTSLPVLYVVRPGLAGQAANLAAHHPATDTALFPESGHALFVDDADRFDRLMQDFIQRRIWP
jgi:non-heme chloroperoxidase